MLIFDPQNETLISLTDKIREKLKVSSNYRLLMFVDGGIIDDIAQIMHDDKIEILSKE